MQEEDVAMTTKEILKLDTKNMSDEAARSYGITILEENLTPDRALIKRRGSLALLFVSTYVILAISDSPQVLLNVMLAVAAVMVFMFFNTLTKKWTRNKTLQQFKSNTFKGGYTNFVKEYQDYLIKDREAQLKKAQKKAEKKGMPVPQTIEELEEMVEKAMAEDPEPQKGTQPDGKPSLRDIATRTHDTEIGGG